MSGEPEEEGEVILPESESVAAARPEPSFRGGRGGGFPRGGRGGFSRGRGAPFRGGRGGGFERGPGFGRPPRSPERQQSQGPVGSQFNRPFPRPEGVGGNEEGEPSGRRARSLSPRGRRPVPPPPAGPSITARSRGGRSVSPPPPSQTHGDAPPNRNRPPQGRTRSPSTRAARPSPPGSSSGPSYSGVPRNRSPPQPPPSSQQQSGVPLKPRQARSRSPSSREGPPGPPPSTFERGGRGRGGYFGNRGGRGGRPVGRDRSADRFEDRFPPPPSRHDDLARSGSFHTNRSDDHPPQRGPPPSGGGEFGPRREDRALPPARRFEGDSGGKFGEDRRPRFPPMEQGRAARTDDFDDGRSFAERRPSYETSPPSRQAFNQQADGRPPAPPSPPPSQRAPRERSRPGRPFFAADLRPYASDARPPGGQIPPRRVPERQQGNFDDRSDAEGNRDDRTRGPPRGEERALEPSKRGRFPVDEGDREFAYRGGPPPAGEFREDDRGMNRRPGREGPPYARHDDRAAGGDSSGMRHGLMPPVSHRPGEPAASPPYSRRGRSPPPPPPPMSGPSLPPRRRSLPPSASQGPSVRGRGRSPSPGAPPPSSARFPPSGPFPPSQSTVKRFRGRSGSPPPPPMPPGSSYSIDDRLRRQPTGTSGDAGPSLRRARSRSPPPMQGPVRFPGRGPAGPAGRGMSAGRMRGPSSGRPRNLQTHEQSDEEEEGVVKIETPPTSSRFGASEIARNLDGVPPLNVLHDRLIASAPTEALKQAEKLRQELDVLRLGQFQSSLSMVQAEMRRKWAEFELRQADEALSEIQASRNRHASLF